MFWQNVQIPCVFPDRDFFGVIFPVFPVQWDPVTLLKVRLRWFGPDFAKTVISLLFKEVSKHDIHQMKG